jgi:hypothetical protein
LPEISSNNGGPAFPRPYSGNGTPSQIGMTLRDYFAAKAMQAIFAGEGARMVAARDQRYDETNWAEIVATNAYGMADAMIAARSAPTLK